MIDGTVDIGTEEECTLLPRNLVKHQRGMCLPKDTNIKLNSLFVANFGFNRYALDMNVSG